MTGMESLPGISIAIVFLVVPSLIFGADRSINSNSNGAISSHPIVIVSNNHNNHPPPPAVNSPTGSSTHYESLLNESSYLTDSEVALATEYTTNNPNNNILGNNINNVYYPGNTGPILSLDDSILAALNNQSNTLSLNPSDPYSSLYFSENGPQYTPTAGNANRDRQSNSIVIVNTTTVNPLPTLVRPPDILSLPPRSLQSSSNDRVLNERNVINDRVSNDRVHPSINPDRQSSNNSSASSSTSPEQVNLHYSESSDGKPRWIDYRTRPPPAFPPRVPGIHGIPSGFRNPLSSLSSSPMSSSSPGSAPGSSPQLPSAGPQVSASLTPAVVTTASPFSQNGHSNPQLVHAFGPSSSNPVGFAGAVPPVPGPSFPASNANQDRRRPMPNITRVERELFLFCWKTGSQCKGNYSIYPFIQQTLQPSVPMTTWRSRFITMELSPDSFTLLDMFMILTASMSTGQEGITTNFSSDWINVGLLADKRCTIQKDLERSGWVFLIISSQQTTYFLSDITRDEIKWCGTLCPFSTIRWSKKSGMNTTASLVSMAVTFGRRSPSLPSMSSEYTHF